MNRTTRAGEIMATAFRAAEGAAENGRATLEHRGHSLVDAFRMVIGDDAAEEFHSTIAACELEVAFEGLCLTLHDLDFEIGNDVREGACSLGRALSIDPKFWEFLAKPR